MERDPATSRFPRLAWGHAGIVAILILSLLLHLLRLDRVGFGNLYYAAAVKSMMCDARLFFFASFDPGGFVTVDKPPLGLWIQAVSAWILGFSGFALLLPQVLAGTASVGVLYVILRRRAGTAAALLAALLLALSPVFVAANRNNTMDSTLLFVMLLAAWALLAASERASLRLVLLAFALVGIGFNIKMMQAYMILPALGLVYLFCTEASWKSRVAHLAAGTLLLAVLSLAWVVAVDLTPEEMRPYVGSTRNNRMLELAVGHNAMARIGGPRGMGRGPRQPMGPPPGNMGPPPNMRPPLPGPGGMRQGPRQGGPGGNETGAPSVLRLFEKPLAGQVSWLLPLALLGGLLAWRGPRKGTRVRNRMLLLWMAWLVPMVIFFSFAGLFHRYYLAMLAPAVAALCGMGLVEMARAWHEPEWRGWALPVAFAATIALHAWMASPFAEWLAWLRPVLLVGGAAATAGLVLARRATALRAGVLGLAAPLLLLAPALWSVTPILYGDDATLPYAGPDLRNGRRRPDAAENLQPMLAYLTEHRDGEKFLVAVPNAMLAAPIILQTGEPVVATGGFGGHDRILTRESLRAMVAAGEVRYFLLQEGGRGPGPGPEGDAEVERWVRRNARVVPPREYGAGRFAGQGPRRPPLALFDAATPPERRPPGYALERDGLPEF